MSIAKLYGITHYKRTRCTGGEEYIKEMFRDTVVIKRYVTGEILSLSPGTKRIQYTHRLDNMKGNPVVYPSDELLILFLIDDLYWEDNREPWVHYEKKTPIIE